MLLTRRAVIERIRRLVYGEQPMTDASITENLVNNYLNDAIGIVAKNNYVESIKLDGIAYVNNAFYTTFKGITITESSANIYTFQLPEFPVGVGDNEGVASVILKDANGNLSYDLVPLTINQVSYIRSMRPIQNKICYWYENSQVFVLTSVPLFNYTANVRMISGGDSSNLDSKLNIPPDYLQAVIEYAAKYLTIERNTVQDLTNNGRDGSPKQ
jgi:hypothetical protein